MDKPRALVSHFPIQNIPDDNKEDLEQMHQFKSDMKTLEYRLKKKIIDLEYSLETEARAHHIESSKLRNAVLETNEKYATETSLKKAQYSLLEFVNRDIESQRDSLAADRESLMLANRDLQSYVQTIFARVNRHV